MSSPSARRGEARRDAARRMAAPPIAPRIAALPMYDFPALRTATDELWSAIAARLRAAGITDVPSTLTRDISHVETWRDPRLLFGQACQYPLASKWHEAVRLLAVPAYAAPGCEGSRYRCAIIVKAGDPAKRLEDLRGRRCAVNERDSNSGSNLLRAAIAPFAEHGRFFASVELTGGHLASVRAVAHGRADTAAIDCVSYAHIGRFNPDLTAGLRILDWTASSPGLPYVTARACDAATVSALCAALGQVLADPALAAVRDALLLSGIDFTVDEDYVEVRKLERDALERGYPQVA
jgi:ABC-type phosphate/phosphonate transport system substrate-binding protein